MASLLKAHLSSQGKKCLAGVKNFTLNLQNVKSKNGKTRVIASFFDPRHYSTETKQFPTPEDGESRIIYRGQLARQMKIIKMFSLATSGSALIGWPLLYSQTMTDAGNQFSHPYLIFSVIAFYSIGTPLLLHYVTKKYSTEIEYVPREDKYIASTLTLFCTKKKLEFKADDVERPYIPSMFTTVEIKGTPLFFDICTFEEPEHCKRLLGYDKPIDFKSNEDDVKTVEDKKPGNK